MIPTANIPKHSLSLTLVVLSYRRRYQCYYMSQSIRGHLYQQGRLQWIPSTLSLALVDLPYKVLLVHLLMSSTQVYRCLSFALVALSYRREINVITSQSTSGHLHREGRLQWIPNTLLPLLYSFT